jgi:2-methylcitrate dehydratase PrpD
MLDRSVKLAHFVDASVQEPAVQAMLRKTVMRIEPAVNDTWQRGTPRPAIVTVKLKDGRALSQRIDNPSGNAGNIELEKVRTKFRDCAQTLGDDESIGRVESTVMDLERLSDITELTQMLAGKRYSGVGIRF